MKSRHTSQDQQTVTTATATTSCLASLVMLNEFQHRFRTDLWLQLQWLQSSGYMNHNILYS